VNSTKVVEMSGFFYHWRGGMIHTKMKSKPSVKITGPMEAFTKSMLSPALYEFALYRRTTDDNALRKGRHLPPKTTGVVT
jgi:hypothetical protein